MTKFYAIPFFLKSGLQFLFSPQKNLKSFLRLFAPFCNCGKRYPIMLSEKKSLDIRADSVYLASKTMRRLVRFLYMIRQPHSRHLIASLGRISFSLKKQNKSIIESETSVRLQRLHTHIFACTFQLKMMFFLYQFLKFSFLTEVKFAPF